ncbi:hypothetical protein FQZ97_1128160 [compost metagenome]
MVAQGLGGEADALVGDAVAGGRVEVDAGHGDQFDFPAGFFEGFAQGGLEQGFVGFQVAGGLVVHRATLGQLLHQQEASLVFDNGCDGDVGLPAHRGLLKEFAMIWRRRRQKETPGTGPGFLFTARGV